MSSFVYSTYKVYMGGLVDVVVDQYCVKIFRMVHESIQHSDVFWGILMCHEFLNYVSAFQFCTYTDWYTLSQVT